MASELDELIGFLSSSSAQVKKAAADIVRGLTGTEEGIQSLATRADLLSAPLLRILSCEKDLAEPAAEALVNLSPEPQLAAAIISAGGIEKAMELVGRPGSTTNRLLIMLLVNLTLLESGAKRLLQEADKLEGLYVQKLVRFFTRFSDEEGSEDQYEHISSILVNITRLETGRKLFLNANKGLLKQILPQVDSRNNLRRKGVAGTVRNCCFEAGSDLSSLLITSQFLWPALLLPLAGKQVYSKEDMLKMPAELASPLSHERETEIDPRIRIEAAEALYLIALQEGGRRALWAVNAPRILQVGYQDEEDAGVMEAYERLGSLLIEESEVQDQGGT